MRICFCIDKLDSGGAERVISTLANEFSNMNQDVFLIETSNPGVLPFYKISEKVNHIQMILGLKKKPNIYKKILMLRQTILLIKPDVVVSFKYQTNIYCHYALTGLKIKHIVSERNNPFMYKPSKISSFLRKPVFKKADGCVFQTRDAISFYFKNPTNHKIATIPNPVFLLSEPLDASSKRNNTILSVGRLEPQKNTKLLIDAFDIVVKKHPHLLLKIYGSGALFDELVKHASELESSKSILFLGNSKEWQDDEKNSLMFVLPSDYEGMPNSLMEAMALGIPSISSDCPIGGPRVLIKDGINGFLFTPRNLEELVQKMLLLIENPRLGSVFSNNNANLSQKYSPKAIAKEWLSFINKIMEQN